MQVYMQAYILALASMPESVWSECFETHFSETLAFNPGYIAFLNYSCA